MDRAGKSVSSVEQVKISLLGEIKKIQATAVNKKKELRELGVFIFFSDENGDAWVLEVTDSDAVQVARGGEPLTIELDENPDTIEINWSHTYTLRDKRFFLTAYADKQETELEEAPTRQINAAIKRMYKRYSPEILSRVHLNADVSAESGAA